MTRRGSGHEGGKAGNDHEYLHAGNADASKDWLVMMLVVVMVEKMMVEAAGGGIWKRKTCEHVCTTTTSGIWLASPHCAHDSGRGGLSVRASSSRTTEHFNFGLHHSEKEGGECRHPMTGKTQHTRGGACGVTTRTCVAVHVCEK